MRYLLRMSGAAMVAVLAWAMTTGLLMLLPPTFAIATLFAGLILFSVGGKLHLRWPVAIGGVMMFGGVFAAALLGALG
jgi:hypothetical protein